MTLGTDLSRGGDQTIKRKKMKIFQSYGHDSNAPLIEKIKEYKI